MKRYALFFTLAFTLCLLDVKGQDWEIVLTNNNKKLEAISFPDSANGWMVRSQYGVYENNILRTIDGGESWSDELTKPPVEESFEDVYFFNDQDGLILSGKSLQKTLDGGETWTQVEDLPVQSNPEYFTLKFIDSVGYILGANGALLKSYDRGNSWDTLSPVIGGSIYMGIDFANKDTGIVVGMSTKDQGAFLTYTVDGGETWNERTINLPVDAVLNDVYFVKPNTAYAVGRGGLVLRTNDGGFSWNAMSRIETESLSYVWADEVYFQNRDTGWVAGTYGSAKNWLVVFQTEDGGENWNQKFKSEATLNGWLVNDMKCTSEGKLLICGFYNSNAGNKGEYLLKGSTLMHPPTSIKVNSSISYLNNYPNPFLSETTIKIEFPKQQEIELKVFNAMGQLVKNIFQGTVNPGIHSFRFKPNVSGAGFYIGVLKTENEILTLKMNKAN